MKVYFILRNDRNETLVHKRVSGIDLPSIEVDSKKPITYQIMMAIGVSKPKFKIITLDETFCEVYGKYDIDKISSGFCKSRRWLSRADIMGIPNKTDNMVSYCMYLDY